MKRAKVTEIVGAFASEGVSYGPFQASADRPYIEVPAHLAAALNLPLHESEVRASEEAQAEGEGGHRQELGRWNVPALVEQVKALTEERDALNLALAEQRTAAERLSDLLNEAGANVTNLTADLARVSKERDEARGVGQAAERMQLEAEGRAAELAAERDALQIRVTELEAIANKPALPMDALARLEAVNGISKTLAQKALDALNAPAEGGEQA